MAIKRFRTRILALATGLLAAAQLAVLASVLYVVERDLVRQTEQNLATGGRVFEAQLEAREQQLLSSVSVLTSDFGFREAVATGDNPTIQSALRNHGERIGADAGLVLSLEGATLASAGNAPDDDSRFRELVEQTRAQGYATGVTLLDAAPHLLVMVPVNAPLPVAWAALGFRLDQTLADELQSLTTTSVSFWARGAGGSYLVSTLPSADQARLITALEDNAPTHDTITLLGLAEDSWYTWSTPLGDESRIDALLQVSVGDALAPYRELRGLLLGVIAVTLSLSVLGAMLLARRVSRPLQAMAVSASRIADGVYDRPVPPQSDEEFDALAGALNRMQKDIAEREERILHQGDHDTLTGLPNRARVQHLLEKRLRHAPGDACFALLLMDVDRFREINDSLGYEVGDRVLQALARRLEEEGSGQALTARMGGNEFLMLLPDCTRAGALGRGLGMLHRLAEPLRLDGLNVNISLRGGASAYPEDGEQADVLLRRAAIALDRARQSHTPLSLYRAGDDEQHLRRLGLVTDLRDAIRANGLSLLYQPKVMLGSGALVGAEALARWQHPSLGPIPPDEFVALAETTGLIRELTGHVLDQALGQCASWRKRVPDFTMAVNLSGLDIMDTGLPTRLQELLTRHVLPGNALVLEITESVLMDDRRAARRQLEHLRALGPRLAIDDFGTGYSSLAQLQQLPVQELKIDRGFIMPLPGGKRDQAIVRSTISLAHDLGLDVVAEGLETDQARQLLESLGCDKGQGYGIGRPMDTDAFEQWMDEHDASRQDSKKRSY